MIFSSRRVPSCLGPLRSAGVSHQPTGAGVASQRHLSIINHTCALHMGILDELLGGGQRQKEYRDFVNRYEQGDPSEGYSDQEVLKRYGDVSHAVPPNQYAQAAIEALGKLSPEERAAFVKMLQERAAARGVAH